MKSLSWWWWVYPVSFLIVSIGHWNALQIGISGHRHYNSAKIE